jgi:hypothetical protein
MQNWKDIPFQLLYTFELGAYPFTPLSVLLVAFREIANHPLRIL